MAEILCSHLQQFPQDKARAEIIDLGDGATRVLLCPICWSAIEGRVLRDVLSPSFTVTGPSRTVVVEAEVTYGPATTRQNHPD